MYKRETELRHLAPNDVYKLAVIIDDNFGWKRLMAIIPKKLNTQEASTHLDCDAALAVAGPKYNDDHIHLIEDARNRLAETRLHAQILLDEWATSGRKIERPTVGVLLQLLVHADLYRAADHVARELLNEPRPARPSHGPAASREPIFLDEIFDDINEYVNDSSLYPGTETINDIAQNVNSTVGNNIDFYDKYKYAEKSVPIVQNGHPIPPPRVQRTARLQSQQQSQIEQQQQQQQQQINNVAFTTTDVKEPTTHALSTPSANNLPNFSALMTTTNEDATQNTDTINVLHSNGDNSSFNPNSQSTELTSLGDEPLPLRSLLAANKTTTSAENNMSQIDLPNISALNINGEHDAAAAMTSRQNNEISRLTKVSNQYESSSSGSSLGDNDDMEKPEVVAEVHRSDNGDYDNNDDYEDDDDNSVPNISLLDQRSSNNDSSLTTVTGTSGDNSFELSSSASNDNIPCISVLQQ